MGSDGLGHLLQFVHQLFVDGEPSGSVEDDHVAVGLLGFADSVAADLHGVLVPALGVDGNADLLPDDFELVNRRRSLEVRRHQHRPLGPVQQHLGHLAARRGLARALQARHEQHGRPRRHKRNSRIDRPHEPHQLIMDDFNHDFGGLERVDDLGADRLLLHLVAELLGHFQVDVGLQQRGANLPHHLGHVGLGDLPPPPQPAENIGEFVG